MSTSPELLDSVPVLEEEPEWQQYRAAFAEVEHRMYALESLARLLAIMRA